MTSLENKKNENQVIEAYLYASDKARLKDMVSDMGAKASDALLNAMNALRAFDLELSDKVIGNDDVIDELEEQIDQECLYSIAMRQPMREDLRFVYVVMKIITDLERIGDQAVNVALRLQKLAAIDPNKDCLMMNEIDEMAELDMTMLKAALDAFIKEDPSIVELTRASRHKVHVLRDGAVEELMKNSSPTSLQDLTTAKLFASMWILRHLSRISDHVLNLAEKIAFIATGISPLTMKKKGKKDTVNTITINLGM